MSASFSAGLNFTSRGIALALVVSCMALGSNTWADCPEDCSEGFEALTDPWYGPWTVIAMQSVPTYEVTTLADSSTNGVPNSGTLRYGIEVLTGPRNIIFDDAINGEIALTKNLRLLDAQYVWIDGSEGRETSGSGITITGAEFEIINSSFIGVRYLRFRPGTSALHCSVAVEVLGIQVGEGETCRVHDILIEHCSMTDARDDTFGVGGRTCRVEVRNCLIGGGELLSQSKGGLSGWGDECTYPPFFWDGCDLYLSMHHNIITDANYRMYRIGGPSRNDFYNNVVGNYGKATDLIAFMNIWAEGWCPRVNIVGNYFRAPKTKIDYGFYWQGSEKHYKPAAGPIVGEIITEEQTCPPGKAPLCIIDYGEINDPFNADSVYLNGNIYSYWTYSCVSTGSGCTGDVETGHRTTTQPADQWELTADTEGGFVTWNGYPNWPTRFQAESPVLADTNSMTPELPPPSADTLSWNSGSDPTSNALCDDLIGLTDDDPVTYGAGPGCRLPLNAPVPDARDFTLLNQLRAGVPSFRDESPTIGYGPGPASNPTPDDEESCVAAGTLMLDWDAATEADYYRVWFWADGQSPTMVSSSSELTATQYEVNVSANTTYHWRIEPRNGCGSASSQAMVDWTFDTNTGPGVATSPSPAHFGILCNNGTPVSYSSLTLSWTAGANAETFDLYVWRSTDSEPGTPTASGLTSPTYTVSSLEANRCYHWRVVSHGECGSTPTAIWRFKTQP